MKTTEASPTYREPRRRDKGKTKTELQLAILRVKNKRLKMSIAAVAAEAGVNPSLIHNTYPDLAEEIRAQMGRTTRQQRDDKAAKLADARAALKELREQLRTAQGDIATLASINEMLRDEVSTLRAQVAGKVLKMPERKGR
ncbi:TetR family transcriptional regulator [Paraburkholderia agricolaris]|uniref:TetR family transcriptional regulator n=1 Tax=Paraburkholderia agricolaris TaxID=2152888 RepID=A0ABW8ZKK9_9BURK